MVYRMRSTKLCQCKCLKIARNLQSLGPEGTALKLGKPQALTELSESQPSEPGLEILASMGEVLGRRHKAP